MVNRVMCIVCVVQHELGKSLLIVSVVRVPRRWGDRRVLRQASSGSRTADVVHTHKHFAGVCVCVQVCERLCVIRNSA